MAIFMMRFMKRIVIVLAVLICCLQGQAKTLNIYCNGDSFMVLIDNDTVNEKNAAKYIGAQINKICLKENPKLDKEGRHIVKINNQKITELKLRESLSNTIKSFTIQKGDKLSVSKDDKVLDGELSFDEYEPLLPSISEIKENLSVTPNFPKSESQFILKAESDTISYTLNNPKGYDIDSIFLVVDKNRSLIGVLKYDSIEKRAIKIPVTVEKTKNPTTAHLEVTIEGMGGERIQIGNSSDIIVENNSDWNHRNIIWIIFAALCVIGLVIYFINKRKRTKDGQVDVSGPTQPDTPDISDQGSPEKTWREDFLKTAEIEDLKNQVKELKEEEDKLRKQLADAIGCISAQEGKLKIADSTISKLRTQIINHQKTINDLNNLKSENEKLKNKNSKLLKEEDTINELKKKNERLSVMNQNLKNEAKKKETQFNTLSTRLQSSEKSKAAKDQQINTLTTDLDRLNHYLKKEQQRSGDLQLRLDGFSKQTHYLYLIDETLSNIEKTLPLAFGNVTDETMRRKLVQPIVVGTLGLDESGMESYKMMWRDEVYNNQAKFFGKDVRQLKDDEVMELLRENFLENLALRDSFNKLVRLYLYSNVGWLNAKLVEAGFDVDAIQTLFIELKNMFNRFGVEISYPHLFIDVFDSARHKDSHRCDIFSIFEPTQELETMMRTQDGEALIVDLVRIGLPRSKTVTRRLPMVSLPNL